MRRGEVWYIHGLGRDRHILVVGNDALTADSGMVLTVPVETDRAVTTDSLVTVRLSAPVAGVVRAYSITGARKERFTELAGSVDEATMDMIDAALRTALDL